MTDSSNTRHYKTFDIVLASTLVAAAVGYLLFKPREANQLPYPAPERTRAKSQMHVPPLMAPLSATIH